MLECLQSFIIIISCWTTAKSSPGENTCTHNINTAISQLDWVIMTYRAETEKKRSEFHDCLCWSVCVCFWQNDKRGDHHISEDHKGMDSLHVALENLNLSNFRCDDTFVMIHTFAVTSKLFFQYFPFFSGITGGEKTTERKKMRENNVLGERQS